MGRGQTVDNLFLAALSRCRVTCSIPSESDTRTSDILNSQFEHKKVSQLTIYKKGIVLF